MMEVKASNIKVTQRLDHYLGAFQVAVEIEKQGNFEDRKEVWASAIP